MESNGNKSRSFFTLTALIAVVIIAAAWFLLISPTLSAASEANAQAQQQEATNANTEVEVNKLRQQYANIDEYETQLVGLQEQIPTDPGYADLQRLFAAVAEKNTVVITSLQFGSAAELEVQSGPDDAATDESAVSTSPSAEPVPDNTSGSGDAESGSAANASRLYGIPVSITVTGRYDDVMATLKELQTMDGRIVLITTVSLTAANARDEQSEASGIDTTGVFAGQVFVLTSSKPTEDAPEDSGTSTSPSPSPSPTN